MKFRKRENLLIENNISRDIDPASGDVKALKTFMHIIVP
jgi:hypothetical protein